MRCWDFFFFKQKTAYEMRIRLEFRRVLFRSRSQNACGVQPGRSDGRIAMKSGTKIVLVALAAGALGVVASIVTNGPGPLLGTEAGQREDRKSVVSGKSVAVRVDRGGRRIIKKKNRTYHSDDRLV